MKTAAKTFGRVLSVLLLVVASAGTVFAQQTLQVAADSETQALLRQAEALLGSNQSQQAYDLLSPRETSLSGNAYFDYLLGVAALDSGRVNAAILSLRRAVSAAPQFAGARMELARALYEAREAGEARALFAALLSEQPPPGVRNVIEQYITAIDTRPTRPPARFAPFAELYAGYDSNANGSTTITPRAARAKIRLGTKWRRQTSPIMAAAIMISAR